MSYHWGLFFRNQEGGQGLQENAYRLCSSVQQRLFLSSDAHYQIDDNYPINGSADDTISCSGVKVAAFLP
jgi:hypothetical protein